MQYAGVCATRLARQFPIQSHSFFAKCQVSFAIDRVVMLLAGAPSSRQIIAIAARKDSRESFSHRRNLG
jgi:hypothetical protein